MPYPLWLPLDFMALNRTSLALFFIGVLLFITTSPCSCLILFYNESL